MSRATHPKIVGFSTIRPCVGFSSDIICQCEMTRVLIAFGDGQIIRWTVTKQR